MQDWHNFVKSHNTKNVVSVLSYDHYNENCQFQADFSTIAYVFVFEIIPNYIEIYLFVSMRGVNARKV